MAEYEDYEKFLWEAGRRAGYPLVRVDPPNMDTLLSAPVFDNGTPEGVTVHLHTSGFTRHSSGRAWIDDMTGDLADEEKRERALDEVAEIIKNAARREEGERGFFRYVFVGEKSYDHPERKYRFETKIFKIKDGELAEEHRSNWDFGSLIEAMDEGRIYTWRWIDDRRED